MHARFGRWLVLALLVTGGIVGLAGGTPATAQDATPAASPVAESTWSQEPTNLEIVTIVAAYAYDEGLDVLVLIPLTVGGDGVATAGDPAAALGEADFTSADNRDGYPRITIGESIFDAYPLDAGDRDSVFRWLWWDRNTGERPATLVMQIEATAGPYVGNEGTATFVSQSGDNAGIVVITLLVESAT
jgi:hypothetical protein